MEGAGLAGPGLPGEPWALAPRAISLGSRTGQLPPRWRSARSLRPPLRREPTTEPCAPLPAPPSTGRMAFHIGLDFGTVWLVFFGLCWRTL